MPPKLSVNEILELPIAKWLENRKPMIPVKEVTLFFTQRGIRQVKAIVSYCSKRGSQNLTLLKDELDKSFPTQPNMVMKVCQMIDVLMSNCEPSLNSSPASHNASFSSKSEGGGGSGHVGRNSRATGTPFNMTENGGQNIVDRRGLGAQDGYSAKIGTGTSGTALHRYSDKSDRTTLERQEAERRRLALKAEEDELEYQRIEALHRKKQREEREALQTRINRQRQEEDERQAALAEEQRKRTINENNMRIAKQEAAENNIRIAKQEAARLKFEREDAARLEQDRKIFAAQELAREREERNLAREREDRKLALTEYNRQIKAMNVTTRADGGRGNRADGAFETARNVADSIATNAHLTRNGTTYSTERPTAASKHDRPETIPTTGGRVTRSSQPQPPPLPTYNSGTDDLLALSKMDINPSVQPVAVPKPPPKDNIDKVRGRTAAPPPPVEPPPANIASFASDQRAEQDELRKTAVNKIVPRPPPATVATEVESLQQWLEKNGLLDILDKLQAIDVTDVATLISTAKEALENCGIKKVPYKKLLSAIDKHTDASSSPPKLAVNKREVASMPAPPGPVSRNTSNSSEAENDVVTHDIILAEKNASIDYLKQQRILENAFLSTINSIVLEDQRRFTGKALELLMSSKADHQDRSKRLAVAITEKTKRGEIIAGTPYKAASIQPSIFVRVRFATGTRMIISQKQPRDTLAPAPIPAPPAAVTRGVSAGSTAAEDLQGERQREKSRLQDKEQAAREKREQDLKVSGSWECGMCKTINQSFDFKCKTCFSSKPRPAMDLAYNDYSSMGNGLASRDSTSSYSRSKSAPRSGASAASRLSSTSRDIPGTGKSGDVSSSYLSIYKSSYTATAYPAPAGESSLDSSYSARDGVVCPECRTTNFGLTRCYNCKSRVLQFPRVSDHHFHPMNQFNVPSNFDEDVSMRVLEKIDDAGSAPFLDADEKMNDEILQATFDDEGDEDGYEMVGESTMWFNEVGIDGFQIDYDPQDFNAQIFDSYDFEEADVEENVKKDVFDVTEGDVVVAPTSINEIASQPNNSNTLEKNEIRIGTEFDLNNTMLKTVKDGSEIWTQSPIVASDLEDVKERIFSANDFHMINTVIRTNSDGLAQFLEENKFPQELLFALNQEQCFTLDGIQLLAPDQLIRVASSLKAVQRVKFLQMFGFDKIPLIPSLSRNTSASEAPNETVGDFLKQQGFTQDTIDTVLQSGIKTPTELLNLSDSQAQELVGKLKKVQQKRLMQLIANPPPVAVVVAPPPSPSAPPMAMAAAPLSAPECCDEDADPLETTEKSASGGALLQQKRMEDMYMQTIIEAQTDRRHRFTSRAIDVLQSSRQQHQSRSRRLLTLIRDAPSSSEAPRKELAEPLGPVTFRPVLRLHAFEHTRDITTFYFGESPVDFTKSKVPIVMTPASGSDAMTMRRTSSGVSGSSGGGKAGVSSSPYPVPSSGGGKALAPAPAAVRRGDAGSGMSSGSGKKSGDAHVLPMAHFPAAPSHAVAPGVTPKTSSWPCPVCKSRNGSENKLCTTCFTLRNPGDWCCKKCRAVNSPSDSQCNACHEYNGEVVMVLPDLGRIGSGFIKGVKAIAGEIFCDVAPRPASPPPKVTKKVIIECSFKCGRCRKVMKFVSDSKEEAARKRPKKCSYCDYNFKADKIVFK